jgi:DNA-directed RNA polymerase specialized sigma24 family protein
MSQNDESVSQWIDHLREGDEIAAARLWARYYRQLIGLACRKLGGAPRRVADEEDVVLSAFHSFCERAQEGLFPDLRDRNDLWRLLVRITERKAINQLRAGARKKRGAGAVAGESVLIDGHAAGGPAGIGDVPGLEPTPEFAAEMVETVDRLFAILTDDELRLIAARKLEGYANEEIAVEVGRSLPTVERRLRMIRTIWTTDRENER